MQFSMMSSENLSFIYNLNTSLHMNTRSDIQVLTELKNLTIIPPVRSLSIEVSLNLITWRRINWTWLSKGISPREQSVKRLKILLSKRLKFHSVWSENSHVWVILLHVIRPPLGRLRLDSWQIEMSIFSVISHSKQDWMFHFLYYLANKVCIYIV